MEEFSQSRGDDSLFDDEIVPLQPSQRSELAQQVEKLKLQQSTQDSSQNQSGRGRGRGRGWKRGHGPVQIQRGGGLSSSKFAPKQAELPQPKEQELQTEAQSQAEQNVSKDVSEKDEGSNTVSAAAEPPADIPTGPAAQTASKTPAVRGDRTATGGVRKPKLSEDELSARLAAAKAKSQSLAEKHARAQADAADFEERERVAQTKRKEEEKSRRALEGERERNRARKLQAVGGREWDAEKNEADFKEKRYGERTRGAPPEEQDLSIYEWREDGDRGRGRGQGRGRGRGRGDFRGRGGRGRGSDDLGGPARTPDVKAVNDFPALPTNTTESQLPKHNPQRKESETVGGSWADQMAS